MASEVRRYGSGNGQGAERTFPEPAMPQNALDHVRLATLDEAPKNSEENAPSQNSAAQGAALGAPEGPDDPNLAIIIQRWPDLPPAMKSGILAMVQATGGA